jgi:hypothetical protein
VFKSAKQKQRGFVLVVTALSIIALVAFVGLVFDTGYLAWMRERAQNASDAAVMGAMLDLKNGDSKATATTDGQSDASVNGFTNGSGNTTVAINNPPLYGSYVGNSSYVEAIVQKEVPNIFMAILGQNNTWIGARSTASIGGNGTSGCIYALDPTASRALSLAGSNTITFNCSAYSESSSSSAYYSEGSITLDLSHTAKVGVVGSYQMNNGTYMVDDSTDANETPTTVTSPGDPLASIAAPTGGTVVASSSSYYDMNSRPVNNNLQPGVYCGGITIGNTNGTTYTMNAGTYIMAGGGFTLQSLASVSATAGVTIYNTASTGYTCSSSYSFSPININGQATFNLNAPTTGSLAGIAIFQDRSITSTSQNQIVSQTTSVINGALYFKNSPLLWSGSNTTNGYLIIVADTITINGNSGLTVNNNYTSLPGGSPIKSAASSGLVE